MPQGTPAGSLLRTRPRAASDPRSEVTHAHPVGTLRTHGSLDAPHPHVSSAPPTLIAARTHAEFPPVHSSPCPHPRTGAPRQRPTKRNNTGAVGTVQSPASGPRSDAHGGSSPGLGHPRPSPGQQPPPQVFLLPLSPLQSDLLHNSPEILVNVSVILGVPGQTLQRLRATLTMTFRCWLGSPRPSTAWPWLLPPPYLKLFSHCHLSPPCWPSGCFLTSPAQLQPRGVCPSNLRPKQFPKMHA